MKSRRERAKPELCFQDDGSRASAELTYSLFARYEERGCLLSRCHSQDDNAKDNYMDILRNLVALSYRLIQ